MKGLPVDKKRNWLTPLLVVALIAAAGAGTSCHSKATGGELVLTGATDRVACFSGNSLGRSASRSSRACA